MRMRFLVAVGLGIGALSVSNAASAAPNLLCSFWSMSENASVDQMLNTNCLLVQPDGALVTERLFEEIGGSIVDERFAFERDGLWGYPWILSVLICGRHTGGIYHG